MQYCIQYRTSAISCFCVAMLAGEFGNRKSPIFCFCRKGKGFLVSRARCCSHAVSARNPRPSKQKQKIGDFLFLNLPANKSLRKQEIADVLFFAEKGGGFLLHGRADAHMLCQAEIQTQAIRNRQVPRKPMRFDLTKHPAINHLGPLKAKLIRDRRPKFILPNRTHGPRRGIGTKPSARGEEQQIFSNSMKTI